MADINLLPQELKPNKSVLIIAKKLKKFSLILGSFLVLSSLAILGVSYYYSQKISEAVSNQTDLEAQIRSLEDTEQRLVLIKDRIGKIISVKSSGTISEEIEIVSKVAGVMPEGVVIKGFSLDKDVVKVEVLASSLDGASRYMNSVTSLDGLKFINLISFDFNPGLGYTIDLNFIAAPETDPASVI